MPIKREYILRIIFFTTIVAFLSSCNVNIGNIYHKKPRVNKNTLSKNIRDKPDLLCKIGRGSIFISGKWKKLQDSDFSVKHEGRVNIHIFDKTRKNNRSLQVIFDNNGQKIILCPVIFGTSNKRISCKSLYFLESDLRDGMKRTIDIRKFIKKSEITCAYNKNNLRSLIPPS